MRTYNEEEGNKGLLDPEYSAKILAKLKVEGLIKRDGPESRWMEESLRPLSICRYEINKPKRKQKKNRAYHI